MEKTMKAIENTNAYMKLKVRKVIYGGCDCTNSLEASHFIIISNP